MQCVCATFQIALARTWFFLDDNIFRKNNKKTKIINPRQENDTVEAL